MTGLRASIGRLPRFDQRGINLPDVAEYLHVERPYGARDLKRRLDAVRDAVEFHADIVTGTALGGELTINLDKHGNFRFRGHMRATGFPSFNFRLSAVVRSPSGSVVVAVQRSGRVFGTDTPGPRQRDWDETGTDPQRAKLIRNTWPDLAEASLTVNRSTELSGSLGTAIDIAVDVAKFVAVAQTFGSGLAICLIIGEELNEIGADVPGMRGIAGLGIIAGSVMIWGPLAIGPALVFGVAAGAVLDAMIDLRRLEQFEIDFANTVFGGSIDFGNVRVTNLVGLGDRAFVTPTVDGTILMNIGGAVNNPVTASTKNYPVPGQLFIHELTHVWQIQHARLEDGYIPGWLCAGIGGKSDGKAAYRPGPAGLEWHRYGIEAQGAIVDQWFAGIKDETRVAKDSPEAAGQSEDSSYFRYIRDNIRLGIA